MLETVQAGLGTAIEWLRLGVELVGALVLGIGVVLSLVRLARSFANDGGKDFTEVRLMLARYLVLALELQLASDILSSAVAPTWDRIGKLAAIAVIRTLLNYFLTREMREVHAHAGAAPAG